MRSTHLLLATPLSLGCFEPPDRRFDEPCVACPDAAPIQIPVGGGGGGTGGGTVTDDVGAHRQDGAELPVDGGTPPPDRGLPPDGEPPPRPDANSLINCDEIPRPEIGQPCVVDDPQCPPGATCALRANDSYVCAQLCVPGGVCEEGLCESGKPCLPAVGMSTYGYCAPLAPDDCEVTRCPSDNYLCARFGDEKSVCRKFCAADEDCDPGTTCVRLEYLEGGAVSLCFVPCYVGTPCPPGEVCFPNGQPSSVCIPAVNPP